MLFPFIPKYISDSKRHSKSVGTTHPIIVLWNLMENIVKKKYAYIKEEKVIILLFLNFFISETIPAMLNNTGNFIRNLQ